MELAPPWRWQRPGWRLGYSMGLGMLLALAAMLASTYAILRQQALQATSQANLEQQQVVARGLDETLAGAERRAAELAQQILRVQPSPAQMVEILKSRVLNDPESSSIGVLLEPGNPVSGEARFASVVSYGAGGLVVADFIQTRYEYWTKDWYHKTVDLGLTWWSDPYFNDAAGGQDTITLDYPLRDERGRVFGMIGVSIAIDRLLEVAGSLGFGPEAHARAIIADANGKLLLAWDPALERAYTLEQAARRTASPALAWMARSSASTPPQVVNLDDPERGRERLAFVPLPRVRWQLATVVSEQQLLAPLHAGMRRMLGPLGLLLLLALPMTLLLTRRIARPLALLSTTTERWGRGDLAPLPALPKTGELGRLAAAVEALRQRLLRESRRADDAGQAQQQAQQERRQVSLVQRHLLPADRVVFGARLQCEMAGLLAANEAVARIAYGFSTPVSGVCLFFVAAVTGQGLVPALHLARLTTLAQTLLRQDRSLDELMRQLSAHAYGEGDIGLQARMLLGRLDLDSGQLGLLSADHGAPWLVRRDGEIQPLELRPGPPLGLHERGDWPQWNGQLAAGERLLIAASAERDPEPRHGLRQTLTAAMEHAGDLPVRAQLGALMDHLHRSAPADSAAVERVLVLLAVQDRD